MTLKQSADDIKACKTTVTGVFYKKCIFLDLG